MPGGAEVCYGTSGWSYRDWLGPFYPKGTASGAFLPSYAERFSTVEVDSTYYAVPRPSTVEGWAAKTPPGFRFALKVPRQVTHGTGDESPNLDRVLRDEGGTLGQFLEVLSALGDKLALVLFQFPYFRVRTMDSEDFLARLDAVLPQVPPKIRCAVEIRNKSWIRSSYLELLARHRAVAVLIDHPYMPGPSQQLRLGMVTTDIAYIRLLGDRHAIEKKTRTWDRVVEEKGDRLEEWAEVIRALSGREEVREVYTFSNNHYAGHAPATVEELRTRVGESAF